MPELKTAIFMARPIAKMNLVLTLFAACMCAAGVQARTESATSADPSLIAGISAHPSAVNTTYTGVPQTLVTAGTAVNGTMAYSLDHTSWSASLPQATNAGTYTVYYRVVGDGTHADFEPDPNSVEVTIAKAPLTIKAEDKQLNYGDPAWWCNQAIYTGFVNGDNLLTALSGTVQFNNEYTTGSNVGTYHNTPYGPTAANYEITFVAGTITVNKVAPMVTYPSSRGDLDYNDAYQPLVTPGTSAHGEWHYKINTGEYVPAVPTAKAVGEYIVYYKFVGDINHKNIAGASFRVNIVMPALHLSANEDPNHPGIYYTTFFHSTQPYQLPNDGTEAYAAEVSGEAMYLHKIAQNDDILPANTAVIFKAPANSITLTPGNGAPVTVTAANHLHGVDAETEIAAVVNGTCYVLSGVNGVGFYLYEEPNKLKAHKAYIDLAGNGMAQAPRKLRFVFNQEQTATGLEDIQGDDLQSTKVLRNGQLYIMYNGTFYNVLGQEVK